MVPVEEKNLTMPYQIRNFSFFMHMQDVAHPHQCEFSWFNLLFQTQKLCEGIQEEISLPSLPISSSNLYFH